MCGTCYTSTGCCCLPCRGYAVTGQYIHTHADSPAFHPPETVFVLLLCAAPVCRTLLHSCQVSLGLFYALLNSMQCGDVTLEICQQHIGDLSEAGVRLSAAFTALGTLICPLKAKKKGKQKKGKRLGWRGRKPQTAAADEAAGAAAAAERMQGGGVGLAAEQLAQYQGVPPRPQPGSPLDVERFGGDGVFESEGEEVEGDDPFAALEDEEHTGGWGGSFCAGGRWCCAGCICACRALCVGSWPASSSAVCWCEQCQPAPVAHVCVQSPACLPACLPPLVGVQGMGHLPSLHCRPVM
jgi:hypothetical protein